MNEFISINVNGKNTSHELYWQKYGLSCNVFSTSLAHSTACSVIHKLKNAGIQLHLQIWPSILPKAPNASFVTVL